MNAETYDDLKQYVGSKNDFTTDLLNMGYTKGKKDGYNQALEDLVKKCDEAKHIMFKQYTVDMRDIREIKKELSK